MLSRRGTPLPGASVSPYVGIFNHSPALDVLGAPAGTGYQMYHTRRTLTQVTVGSSVAPPPPVPEYVEKAERLITQFARKYSRVLVENSGVSVDELKKAGFDPDKPFQNSIGLLGLHGLWTNLPVVKALVALGAMHLFVREKGYSSHHAVLEYLNWFLEEHTDTSSHRVLLPDDEKKGASGNNGWDTTTGQSDQGYRAESDGVSRDMAIAVRGEIEAKIRKDLQPFVEAVYEVEEALSQEAEEGLLSMLYHGLLKYPETRDADGKHYKEGLRMFLKHTLARLEDGECHLNKVDRLVNSLPEDRDVFKYYLMALDDSTCITRTVFPYTRLGNGFAKAFIRQKQGVLQTVGNYNVSDYPLPEPSVLTVNVARCAAKREGEPGPVMEVIAHRVDKCRERMAQILQKANDYLTKHGDMAADEMVVPDALLDVSQKKHMTVGVIGGAGTMGQAAIKRYVELGVRQFVVYDSALLPARYNSERREAFLKSLEEVVGSKIWPEVRVKFNDNVSPAVAECDLIFSATGDGAISEEEVSLFMDMLFSLSPHGRIPVLASLGSGLREYSELLEALIANRLDNHRRGIPHQGMTESRSMFATIVLVTPKGNNKGQNSFVTLDEIRNSPQILQYFEIRGVILNGGAPFPFDHLTREELGVAVSMSDILLTRLLMMGAAVQATFMSTYAVVKGENPPAGDYMLDPYYQGACVSVLSRLGLLKGIPSVAEFVAHAKERSAGESPEPYLKSDFELKESDFEEFHSLYSALKKAEAEHTARVQEQVFKATPPFAAGGVCPVTCRR